MGSNPTTDNTFLRKNWCQVFSVNIPSLPVPMPSSGRKWVTNANNSSKNHHSTPHPQVQLLVFYFYTVVKLYSCVKDESNNSPQLGESPVWIIPMHQCRRKYVCRNSRRPSYSVCKDFTIINQKEEKLVLYIFSNHWTVWVPCCPYF